MALFTVKPRETSTGARLLISLSSLAGGIGVSIFTAMPTGLGGLGAGSLILGATGSYALTIIPFLMMSFMATLMLTSMAAIFLANFDKKPGNKNGFFNYLERSPSEHDDNNILADWADPIRILAYFAVLISFVTAFIDVLRVTPGGGDMFVTMILGTAGLMGSGLAAVAVGLISYVLAKGAADLLQGFISTNGNDVALGKFADPEPVNDYTPDASGYTPFSQEPLLQSANANNATAYSNPEVSINREADDSVEQSTDPSTNKFG